MAIPTSQALLDILYDVFQAIKNTGGSYTAGVSTTKKNLAVIAEEAEILPYYRSQPSNLDT